MQSSNELFFVVAALIMWGLVIISKPLLQQTKKFQPKAYWYVAFIFTASSFTFFAIASTINIALLTVANSFFVAGHLYAALFCYSIRNPLAREYKFLPLAAILAFGLIFEYIRQTGTFSERVLLVNLACALCLVWQLRELGRIDKSQSKYLKLFLFATSAEFVFAMSRLGSIFFIDFQADMNLYQEPFVISLVRCAWFAFSAVSYVMIIGYWIERFHTESIRMIAENLAMKLELANKHSEQVERQFLASLNALAKARDDETGNHIIRTQFYVKTLADRLRSAELYTEILTDKFINNLFKAAPLHDIGKVGIPDNILLKNGPLTDDEWSIMKTHTLIGENILNSVDTEQEGEADLVGIAIKIAGGHHEKWDGTGYPRGLAGQAIPLEARIMSLADIYDALVSERIYKKAWTVEQATQEIISKSGSYFDPLVVDAFLAEQRNFLEIYYQYRDA